MIKFSSLSKGTLLRMDDVAENMNWHIMNKIEILFDKYNIKPVIGVIPNNKDPELLKFPKEENFWEKIKTWQKKGWEISMHGYSHEYEIETKKRISLNWEVNQNFSVKVFKIKFIKYEMVWRSLAVKKFL